MGESSCERAEAEENGSGKASNQVHEQMQPRRRSVVARWSGARCNEKKKEGAAGGKAKRPKELRAGETGKDSQVAATTS